MLKLFVFHSLAVDVVHSNGNVLVLAIASEGCYAYYMDTLEETPNRSSLGTNTLSDKEETVVFMYGRDYSEIPQKYIIPFEDLLQVTRAFFVTGTWPETIRVVAK